MLAVVCERWGGPELLRVAEVPLPEPGPGQVRVRIGAAGVNYPDVLIVQKKYQVQPQLPFVPGAEVAGIIEAVGSAVSGLHPGMAVVALCGTGGFAEACVVDATRCVPLPQGLSMELGASLLLAWGTAWHALRDRACLRPGETLLVLGAAGGVGLAAVSIGHALGARVIAAAGSEEKLAACRSHGAEATIDYETEDLREGLRRVAPGKGPDVVFDGVGGRASEAALRSIAWRGRHLVVGFASGAVPSIALNLPLLKGAALIGVFWGEFVQREPQTHAAGVAEMFDWVASGRLRPLISRRYPLAEAPQALADLAARRVVGKVVVVPGTH